MPSIHRRGKSWTVRWREGGRGSPLLAATYQTKTLASQAAREIEARINRQKPARSQAVILLPDLVQMWLDSRPQTYRAKVEAEIQRALGPRTQWRVAADIDRAGVMGLKAGEARLVKALLRFAGGLGQRVDPGALMARRARQKRPGPSLLTDEQAAAAQELADSWGPCYGLAVHLVRTYGHRPASLCACSIGALEGELLTLPVKGGDIHRHPVLPETVERWSAAAAGRDPGEPVLLHSEGRPWKSSTSLTSWYYHQIGQAAHPHDQGIYALKRWAISRMLAAGLDAVTVASLTGHRTPSLLMDVYARTHEGRQAAALEVLRRPGVLMCSH